MRYMGWYIYNDDDDDVYINKTFHMRRIELIN